MNLVWPILIIIVISAIFFGTLRQTIESALEEYVPDFVQKAIPFLEPNKWSQIFGNSVEPNENYRAGIKNITLILNKPLEITNLEIPKKNFSGIFQ